MRNLIIYVFMFVILFLAMGKNALAIGENSEPNYLSVRTSLIPLLNWNGGIGFPPNIFPANRINPAAKEHICYCLSSEYAEKSNRDTLNIRLGGIWLLGFIGDKSDIQLVDNFIQKNLSSKELSNRFLKQGYSCGHAVGSFSGMMLKREIEGARFFFEKYAENSSWMPAGHKETPVALRNAQKARDNFLYYSYLYSKSKIILPYLLQSTESKHNIDKNDVDVLLKMEVDFFRQFTEPSTLSQEELNSMFDMFLETRGWGEVIDALMNKEKLKIPLKPANDSKDTEHLKAG